MAIALEEKLLEKKDAAAQFRLQVDEQIAQTTGRIRTHDLLFGGLTLGGFAAFYATVMILTDKYFNLAEWVRQLALGGFLLMTAGGAIGSSFARSASESIRSMPRHALREPSKIRRTASPAMWRHRKKENSTSP